MNDGQPSPREGPVRIAFFVNQFPAASETFVLNQIAGMIERGHDVEVHAAIPASIRLDHPALTRFDIMARTRFRDRVPAGWSARLVNAIRLAWRESAWRQPLVVARALNLVRYRRAAASLRVLYEALPFVGRKPYDVVHCQFGTIGPMALRLRQIGALRGRLVTSFRGYDATQFARSVPGFYSELFREGDLFLPVSEALKRRLIELGCSERKIRVHHSGVDCQEFAFAERHPAPGGVVNVLTVARLVEKKGVAYAIRAIAEAIRSGRRLSYSIAGDGGMRAELERLIQEFGMDRHVRLLGWRSRAEVLALMRDAHMLVAPSVTATDGDEEGIPNVVKEAMAVGLPVISTIHGGIPELVDDGGSGFLVPERDVAALAERLGYLCGHPERWPEMGRIGRSRIERDFDITRLNDRLERLYAGIDDE